MASLGFAGSRPAAATTVLVGALCLSAGLVLGPLLGRRSGTGRRPPRISSPARTILPAMSEAEISSLPYPPDVLPGARDVETPYGFVKVFEWGPEAGEKVLLMHGIGTPCLALGDMAEELAGNGYRVMVFDFFGRGYSDAPTDIPYDMRLYAAQILLVLASSPLAWTGDDAFHLIGYSLGGGVSAAFAGYFPRILRSLTLVAPGGLIRPEHVSWTSRLLYSAGLLPEALLERLVRWRITPSQKVPTAADDVTEEKIVERVIMMSDEGAQGDQEGMKKKKGKGNSDATGGHSFDNAAVSRRRPGAASVSSVMGWQLRHHDGFVLAFMSSIRHAPIYDQQAVWRRLGGLLAARRKRDRSEGEEGDHLDTPPPPGLAGGKVLLVLGLSDPVIRMDEVVPDAEAALGRDRVEVATVDCGHEVAIARGEEVAALAMNFWRSIHR